MSKSRSTASSNHASGQNSSSYSGSTSHSGSTSLDTSSTDSSDFISEVDLQPRVMKPLPDKWDDSNKIGKGEHATVHRAKLDDTDIAVKVIRLSKKETPAICEYELKAMVFLLQHAEPYIVKLMGYYYNSETNPATCTIALEYMNNGSLRDWIKNPTTTLFSSQVERRAGLCHLAEGLVIIHGHDVLLGDIKASNILIKGAELKFADFGLSISAASADDKYYGTPDYMAPEVLKESKPMSKASDIYSFSLVILEMITKTCVSTYYTETVKIKTVSELVKFLYEGKRPPIPQDATICPPKLARLLSLGFLKFPGRRPDAIDIVDCFQIIEAETDQALTETRQSEGLPRRKFKD